MDNQNNEEKIHKRKRIIDPSSKFPNFYSLNDLGLFFGKLFPSFVSKLSSINDLLDRDNQREKDGFPRKIKMGRLAKPVRGKNTKVIVVPTTTEDKFYHDPTKIFGETNLRNYSDNVVYLRDMAGTGKEDIGEVIGHLPLGGGSGGQGNQGGDENGEHDVNSEAYELGKILTEKFQLPNLKDKGKKRSLTKFIYELTDINKKVGQVLDKKGTLKNIVKTNILLGKINPDELIDPQDLIVDKNDLVYKILSKERDYEPEAVVFFLRDYSGSMDGKPTEIVVQQHLWIYSWLMFQYKNNVMSRFILHDTEAKEVPDFYTYYNSQVNGGTMVSSAYKLVNEIVSKENLAKSYSIYVFHGTDGDDFGNATLNDEIKKILTYSSRFGITIIRNSSDREPSLEHEIKTSGLLEERSKLIRLDSFLEEEASEERIIQGIKNLIS